MRKKRKPETLPKSTPLTAAILASDSSLLVSAGLLEPTMEEGRCVSLVVWSTDLTVTLLRLRERGIILRFTIWFIFHREMYTHRFLREMNINTRTQHHINIFTPLGRIHKHSCPSGGVVLNIVGSTLHSGGEGELLHQCLEGLERKCSVIELLPLGTCGVVPSMFKVSLYVICA